MVLDRCAAIVSRLQVILPDFITKADGSKCICLSSSSLCMGGLDNIIAVLLRNVDKYV